VKRVYILVVAGGSGSRADTCVPKQFMPLGDTMVLTRTLDAFLRHPFVDKVRVCVCEDMLHLYYRAVSKIDNKYNGLLMEPVMAGSNRQETVYKGLYSFKGEGELPAHVLIHDAARPFISDQEITSVISSLSEYDIAVPVTPMRDTVRDLSDTLSGFENSHADCKLSEISIVDRRSLYATLTPQGFSYNLIMRSHELCKGMDCVDDLDVVRRAVHYGMEHDSGLLIKFIHGDVRNFKITYPSDYERAIQYTNSKYEKECDKCIDIRVGTGYDLHTICDGHEVVLGGIRIPCDFSLKGHSDADVVLHALTDALLGMSGNGDIGRLFPPSDDCWKGQDSSLFLNKAAELLYEQGGQVTYIDIIVVCETPRISVYADEIAKCIAGILSISSDRVSVKGKTSEGVGCIGRHEAIEAFASATVIFS